jgi:UDP-N-acetylmuramate dehydrogenase
MITDQQLKELKHHFPQLKFKPNYSLSRVTYFKVGGPAELFVAVKNRVELIDLIRFVRSLDLEFVILGGGSNVIAVDVGLAGLVISTQNELIEVEVTSSPPTFRDVLQYDHVEKIQAPILLRADCGVITAVLVNHSVRLGLSGLEPFLGVPGRLGGAIYNNSHFQKNLIGDYVVQVEVLGDTGDVYWVSQDECQFAYDQSRFQQSQEVILRAVFLLQPGDTEESRKILRESAAYRVKTQPLGLPSSGCIFRNVPNTSRLHSLFPKFADNDFISAGFLIDQAGLKGLRVGGVEISQKHAAFMVNRGGGTAKEINELIEKTKVEVEKKYGVTLVEEIFWLGKK